MILTRNEFLSAIEQAFAFNGLLSICNDNLSDRLFDATNIILEKNKVMNLTAICSEEEFIYRHWVDVLLCEKYIPQSASLLDVGTGAGILAIACAAARPDIKVLAIDSTAKKTLFLSDCAKILGLTNLTALSARAEELSRDKKYREKFDFVAARAVAALPALCELCIPFVKTGGTFCALKGKNGTQELSESLNAIKALGGSPAEDIPLMLDELSGGEHVLSERHLIISQKASHTPDIYPRRYAQITKSPL